MSKVYIYPQKIFKYLASLVVVFGVISCASSQTTAASSGETDGVYYSPSKDGQVEYASNEDSTQNYDIQVGSPYFDAEGNGAEDFYYEEPAQSQDVNIYTGSNNIYVDSGASTDWGRYDGIDITVNNWGWNDPWWGWGGYYGYNAYWGWGYPRWNSWYGSYWGGHYGYNPYWGYYNPYYYNPYWGYGYGNYYGGYGYYGGYYYRGTPARPGYRPGSNLAYTHNPGLSGYRQQRLNPVRSASSYRKDNVRPVRNVRPETGVRNATSNPTRTDNPRAVRTNDSNNNVRSNTPNVRSNEPRPVRATRPQGVRPNTPVRTTQPNREIRTNTPPRSNTNVTPRNSSPRSDSGVRTSTPSRSNSGNVRSSSPSPSRSSGSTGGGRRR